MLEVSEQISPFDLPELVASILQHYPDPRHILVSKKWMKSIEEYSEVCQDCGKIVRVFSRQLWVGCEDDTYCHAYYGTVEDYIAMKEIIKMSSKVFEKMTHKSKELCYYATQFNNCAYHVPPHLIDERIAIRMMTKCSEIAVYNRIPKHSRTHQLHVAMLNICSYNIQYIDQTLELCIYVSIQLGRNGGDTFKYFKFQTDEICIQALEYSLSNIRYINDINSNIVEAYKRIVAKKNLHFDDIRYAKKQNDELCIAALEHNLFNIQFIDDVNDNIIANFMRIVDEHASYKYLKYIIGRIKNPTDELLKLTIQYSPEHIKNISNPSKELEWVALKSDPSALRQIKNPTNEMFIYAYGKSCNNIRYY